MTPTLPTTVRPSTAGAAPTVPLVAPPGLKGVIVADTEIGAVRGDEGFFHYRDHDATRLAASTGVEDVWHLLLHGRLPELAEATAWATEVGAARAMAAEVLEHAERVTARTGPGPLALQALLPIAVPHARSWLDVDPGDHRRTTIAAAVAVPVLLAASAAVAAGRPPLEPDPVRSHAEDWLRMALGRSPDPTAVRLVEPYLVLTMDHGFNASTFTTRVVTSTGADPVSALSAGVGALSGPLHGGAPARALAMIDDIGDPDRAPVWVADRLERGEKIMGFGHAVYRAGDPRSALLRERAIEHGGELVERAVAIEERILATLRERKPDAVIVTNVEYYAGIVLHLAGLPADLFTPTFTVSRALGWAAHVIEQAADNKIVRPSSRYVGPAPTGSPGS